MNKVSRLNKICWVKKASNVEDLLTGDSFEAFTFSKAHGRKGRVLVERDKAFNEDHVYPILLRKNALLPPNAKAAKQIIRDAIKSAPPKHLEHAQQLGWLANNSGFVRSSGVLGAVPGPAVLQPPLWLNDRQVVGPRGRGTMEGWRNEVLCHAKYSTLLRFVLSIAFATPLLKQTRLQNFGINIFGRTKVGKTTALLVATSVAGIGSERGLPNWNATGSSLAETARVFNDLVLPINEIGLLAGKKGDAYGTIREQIYRLSEGRERGRLSGHSMATHRSISTWRSIFVSTSEYSINDYAIFAGETRSGGEYARCMDVPAILGTNSSTIFDSYPNSVKKTERKRWARDQLVTLRSACAKHHGRALDEFVQYVMKERKLVQQQLAARMDEFKRKIRDLRLDGALQHAGVNFALIYAGGAIAIDAGILPWSHTQQLETILNVFREAVADVRGHLNARARGKRILRQKVYSGEITLWSGDQPKTANKTAGFMTKDTDGNREVTVRADAFRRWFKSPSQARAVLLWLHEEGLLVLGEKKVRPSPTTTRWAERTLRWSGKPVRSFVFRYPFEPLR
jgi:hypothetical protein